MLANLRLTPISGTRMRFTREARALARRLATIDVLSRGRLHIAALCVGMAQRVLDALMALYDPKSIRIEQRHRTRTITDAFILFSDLSGFGKTGARRSFGRLAFFMRPAEAGWNRRNCRSGSRGQWHGRRRAS